MCLVRCALLFLMDADNNRNNNKINQQNQQRCHQTIYEREYIPKSMGDAAVCVLLCIVVLVRFDVAYVKPLFKSNFQAYILSDYQRE